MQGLSHMYKSVWRWSICSLHKASSMVYVCWGWVEEVVLTLLSLKALHPKLQKCDHEIEIGRNSRLKHGW